MLNEIIAKYLDISPDQANGIIELFALEQLWASEHRWSFISKEAEAKESQTMVAKPEEIKTQEDFINFLQVTGQSKLFGGHDRAKFLANDSRYTIDNKDQILKQYYDAFCTAGLCEEKNYFVLDEKQQKPNFSIVLGSSAQQVEKRVAKLINDLKSDLTPKNGIVGLGTTDRALGQNVIFDEEKIRKILEENKQDPNEMNMVNYLIQNKLQEHGLLQYVNNYVGINTSTGVSRERAGCATTGATATNLKDYIEKIFPLLDRPVVCLIYSNQPFVERQRRDIQQKLGVGYQTIGVGDSLSYEEFKQNKNSISICLGEVARLININYTRQNREKFINQPLTTEELAELEMLTQAGNKKQSGPVNLSQNPAALFSNKGAADVVLTSQPSSLPSVIL